MREILKPKQRGIKTGKWAYQMLLAGLLLILAACQAASGPDATPTSMRSATSSPAPSITTSPIPTEISTPTPPVQEPAPSPTPNSGEAEPVYCGIDAAARVLSPDYLLSPANPDLGAWVETVIGYTRAMGIDPTIPYNENVEATRINQDVQQDLQIISIHLARIGRAVVLPEFAQDVGLRAVIQREVEEAQVFFAGVDDELAPDNALRVVMHATRESYVLNIVEGINENNRVLGGLQLLVEKDSGMILGFPDQLTLDRQTQLISVTTPGRGQIAFVRIDGCNWLVVEKDAGGRVRAVLEVEPGMDAAALAWQVNPNLPEAWGEEGLFQFCPRAMVQLGVFSNMCDLLTPEMTQPLAEEEISSLTVRTADGNFETLNDGRIPMLDLETEFEDGWNIDRGLACTIRGSVTNPSLRGAILVYCEVKLGENLTQGAFFPVLNQTDEWFVHWLEDGVLPETAEEFGRPSRINWQDLLQLFQSGRMNGRQIAFRYTESRHFWNSLPGGPLAIRNMELFTEAMDRGIGINLLGDQAVLDIGVFIFNEEVLELIDN